MRAGGEAEGRPKTGSSEKISQGRGGELLLYTPPYHRERSAKIIYKNPHLFKIPLGILFHLAHVCHGHMMPPRQKIAGSPGQLDGWDYNVYVQEDLKEEARICRLEPYDIRSIATAGE